MPGFCLELRRVGYIFDFKFSLELAARKSFTLIIYLISAISKRDIYIYTYETLKPNALSLPRAPTRETTRQRGICRN